MPGSVIAGSHHTSHGDLFLMAERKNRMERARLDKQLRLFDRESARHEFFIERQKRTVVTKWQSVALTTGHSDKALPPSGPEDNVYGSSRHGKFRLSEKRLIEWKVRERQLEKFMRQYEPHHRSKRHGCRPHTSPTSKPSTGDLTDGAGHAETYARPQPGTSTQQRVESAGNARLECRPAFRRRCMSAVNLSTRSDVNEDETLLDDVDFADDISENDAGREAARGHVSFSGVHDSKSMKHSPKIHSGIRSMSAVYFHDSLSSLQSQRRPVTSSQHRNHKVSGDDGRLQVPGELSKTQATEDLGSSTQDYKTLQKARHDSGTQFFITKSNVVMTNTISQTCRELAIKNVYGEAESGEDEGSTSDTNSLPSVADKGKVDIQKSLSNTFGENMSITSLSTEDNADGVFDFPYGHSDINPLVHAATRTVNNTDGCQHKGVNVTNGNRTSVPKINVNGEDVPEAKTADNYNTDDVKGTEGYDENFAAEKERNADGFPNVRLASVRSPAQNEEDAISTKEVVSPVPNSLKKLTILESKDTGSRRPSSTIGFHAHKTHRRHTLNVSSGKTMNIGDADNQCRRHNSVHAGPEKRTGTSNSLLQRRRESDVGTLNTAGTFQTTVHASGPSQKDMHILHCAKAIEPTSATVGPMAFCALGQSKRRPHTTASSHRRSEDGPVSPPAKAPMSLKRFQPDGHDASSSRGHPNSLNPLVRPGAGPGGSVQKGVKVSAGASQTQRDQQHSTHQSSRPDLAHPRPKDHADRDRLPHQRDQPRTGRQSVSSVHTDDPESDPTEPPETSQWRRDLAREQPPGLGPSVGSLGTVIKAAMVFSKSARRRALSSMVEENNVDTREVIRKERLRVLQSRASVLNKIVSQFPVHGDR